MIYFWILWKIYILTCVSCKNILIHRKWWLYNKLSVSKAIRRTSQLVNYFYMNSSWLITKENHLILFVETILGFVYTSEMRYYHYSLHITDCYTHNVLAFILSSFVYSVTFRNSQLNHLLESWRGRVRLFSFPHP